MPWLRIQGVSNMNLMSPIARSADIREGASSRESRRIWIFGSRRKVTAPQNAIAAKTKNKRSLSQATPEKANIRKEESRHPVVLENWNMPKKLLLNCVVIFLTASSTEVPLLEASARPQ
mmetsp:Transcript_101172/g.179452  ORF Transcript_101172/g.179452 Transcript_101172/m.179452 type:complete len:119 (+) Transcript_101172:83-439(+)